METKTVELTRRSHADLHVPDPDEITKVLRDGLSSHFADVTVKWTVCPNLQLPPFSLASEGLCGHPVIADVGGVPNLVPTPKLEKVYTLGDVVGACGLEEGLVLGAGAGSHVDIGVNSELMANVKVKADGHMCHCETRISLVDEDGGEHAQRDHSGRFSLMGNFLVSQGHGGQVLHVRVAKRTTECNLVTCIRTILKNHYGDLSVGLGGVFVLEKGKANIHVMPGFSPCPLNSDAEVNQWLRFYDVDAPMVFLGVLFSHDPGLDLRIEHFHGYNLTGDRGGHYHHDVTPDEVVYDGYFSLADKVYRLDPPNGNDGQ